MSSDKYDLNFIYVIELNQYIEVVVKGLNIN